MNLCPMALTKVRLSALFEADNLVGALTDVTAPGGCCELSAFSATEVCDRCYGASSGVVTVLEIIVVVIGVAGAACCDLTVTKLPRGHNPVDHPMYRSLTL